MSKLFVMDHPLIQHKLSTLRGVGYRFEGR